MNEVDRAVDWEELSNRAAFASHRLIGWIFWDPVGTARYAALGVPDGLGYYIATRAAPIAAAGDGVVTATFGSIHPDFVTVSMQLCRDHTTPDAAFEARNEAVAEGLRTHVPDLVDPLGEYATELWAAADALSSMGRPLFAAHRAAPRPEDDPALSAWLALNCIREWRGDTHWAIQVNEGLSEVAAMVLDGRWRGYADDWLPTSRGASPEAIAAAKEELAARGLITDGVVNEAGVAYRQSLEDRLDRLTATPWRHLGAERTTALCELIEPHGPALMARIDETAGTNWMPAGRNRPGRTP